MAGEGEHAGRALQQDGGRGEAVRARSPALRRVGHPEQLEAAAGEPVADLRHQVRLPPAAGPHHRAAGRAQLGAVADRAPHVVIGHVAEHPADQHQVGRHHSGVVVGQRRVAGYHLHLRQPRGLGCVARRGGVARIEFDQAGRHVVATGMAGQGADQVTALAGAQADCAQRGRRRRVQRRPDLVLDRCQAPGEYGAGLVVVVVPRVPVPFGHTSHATDVAGAAAHRDNAVVGPGGAGGLERLALDVAVVRRTYWLARGPPAPRRERNPARHGYCGIISRGPSGWPQRK